MSHFTQHNSWRCGVVGSTVGTSPSRSSSLWKQCFPQQGMERWGVEFLLPVVGLPSELHAAGAKMRSLPQTGLSVQGCALEVGRQQGKLDCQNQGKVFKKHSPSFSWRCNIWVSDLNNQDSTKFLRPTWWNSPVADLSHSSVLSFSKWNYSYLLCKSLVKIEI